MLLFQNPINIALLLVACALHAANTFLCGIYAKIGQIVNIILHLTLFLVFFLSGMPLEETALAFMLSTLVLLLFGYIDYEMKKRCGERSPREGSPSAPREGGDEA